MSQETKSEIDLIREFENSLQVYEEILTLENGAIVDGNIELLKVTAESKMRLKIYLQKLWALYRNPMLEIADERREHFKSLEGQLITVKKSTEKNLRMLTALKISTVKKIEASTSAWNMRRNKKMNVYGADAKKCDRGVPLGLSNSRLT